MPKIFSKFEWGHPQLGAKWRWGRVKSANFHKSSSSSSSFISDTRSIEITIEQHRGQTGNMQKYTQNDRSNEENERDKDRNENIDN